VAETPLSRRTWRDRAVVLTLLASLLLGAFVVVQLARQGLDDSSADAEPTSTTTTVVPETTTTAAPQGPQIPASTTLATPHGEVAAYDRPNGTEVGTAGRWYGYPMTMPVIEETWGWVKVRMPERPNGSTAWLRVGDVGLSTTEYYMVVDRTNTHVHVYKGGVEAFAMPAGMGKASTPTPLGSFFVAVIENPGPSGYGPIVLDLSAHSEAIQSWQGAGDAIIALHGSFGADAKIGTTGTYVSNGCIRLHREDQLKLAEVPLGTPVEIIE
jgi:lipoprotein-anchoring transpeptidase ErfK/SrfK